MTLPELISETFTQKFGRDCDLLIRSSGRINIIGEHTDYNDGFVLPAAIDKYIYFAVGKNGTDSCRFWANDIEEADEVDLDDIQSSDQLWANYLFGILEQFQQMGVSLEGIDVVFGGNLPIGSGMSSSAAMEVGFATALKHLFGVEIQKPEIAKLAQRSSHQFIGVPCGIMDQFASVMGKKDRVIRLDCRSLEYDYIPFYLEDYQVVMINSKVSHSLASSEYGTRVKECQSGVAILQQHYPDVKSLRDVSLEQLEKHQEDMPEVIYKRCHYVVAENERLLRACDALEKGDIAQLGQLLNETHDGLRYEYEVSAPEVDFLVEFAQQFPGVAGSRIMGGGFGGCSINLVKKDRVAAFKTAVLQAYQDQYSILGEAYEVAAVDGTRPAAVSVN
ncbi:galactokinase [Flavilitoribacter nigricans]|uniref:Galactokinase n=1 Tax=Flavilitoribacter nigricans (strain ATCC 23147 / DSM 23189 / NBRC 102662 / NCIMB 1420 / SS-2) TaxID=1122177 RepID=A0A2D0NJ52_FLAN2|nr:galactokinase [Flavilitoribacter nigricans]PHN08522.1 galactokinase [Flavilitoribacter nigricans DSM 23189 = NBRC 102662]